MPETKEIGSISVVTDSETSYDNIGDIQGGFDDSQLRKQIEAHGTKSLLETLAYMQWQVWDMMRTINSENHMKDAVAAIMPEHSR